MFWKKYTIRWTLFNHEFLLYILQTTRKTWPEGVLEKKIFKSTFRVSSQISVDLYIYRPAVDYAGCFVFGDECAGYWGISLIKTLRAVLYNIISLLQEELFMYWKTSFFTLLQTFTHFTHLIFNNVVLSWINLEKFCVMHERILKVKVIENYLLPKKEYDSISIYFGIKQNLYCKVFLSSLNNQFVSL